jgi:hypothetical protein
MKKTVINEILITLLKNTRIKQIMIHILSTYNLCNSFDNFIAIKLHFLH